MKGIRLILLSALAVGASLNLQPSTALAQATVFSVLTITNPTPEASDYFGRAVAALGTDRMLIGAPYDDTAATNGGAVYLFSTNGSLLTAFTDPTPLPSTWFGFSVVAIGTNRVLIGAPNDYKVAASAGAAYLFSIYGTLLTTFTSPTSEANAYFGYSLAAAGTGQVLIGAPHANAGASAAGAAYLFSTNGSLLSTFTNPTPAKLDFFGIAVATVESDQVLIGAYEDDHGAIDAGAAYLFSTNGALLTTFTNPMPTMSAKFGVSVTAVGTDRVLIGAEGNESAYLFRADGTLVHTFKIPRLAADAHFGCSVAAVGTERVLIGAYQDDTGASDAGAAYLFNTNGTLLTTITNPTPAWLDYFSQSVAAMGADRVLIGAYMDSTGASFAGAAYLFHLEPFTPEAPNLTLRITTTNTVAVSWSSPSTGWTLQQNTNGVTTVNWSNAPGAIQDDGTTKALIVNPPTGNQFYRLFKP